MTVKFSPVLPLLALLLTTACSMLDEAQPEAPADVVELTPEPASQPPVAKTVETETESKQEADEPIVMVQPQPIPTIPEAKAMPMPEPMPVPSAEGEPVTETVVEPADITTDIQPAPTAKPDTAPKPAVATGVVKKAMSDELAGKGDNYFIIEIAEKDNTHPAYGIGHKLGMVLNGVQGKTIFMRRGETYEYDIRTDPLHDVYFSTSKQGWGGGVVVDGIKGQFTYKGIIKYQPDEKTPDVIYYQCRNHNTMGGKIFVVDKNTDQAKINKLIADDKKTATKAVTKQKTKVSAARVKQKLSFADMMFMSKGTKRVNSSNHADAKQKLGEAKTKLASARKLLTSGDNAMALEMADEVLRLIGAASRLVPSEVVLAEQNERYLEILDAVENFRKSHKNTYASTVKKRGKKAAVEIDNKEMDTLLADAKTEADKKQYLKAIPLLEKAESIVTSAINVMLDSQTIVYDLNFETAEEEYLYELGRFKGYADLVPVAIARKRPAPGAVKLMDGFVVKGESQRADAMKKAEAGDFPTAIAMMLSATNNVRRALRIAGVSQ